MAVQTRELRDLPRFEADQFLVTSVYLDIRAQAFPAVESTRTSLDSLMHDADARLEQLRPGLPPEVVASLEKDLRRVRRLIPDGITRENTAALAVFACSARRLWQVVPLSRPAPNRVVFQSQPYVAPIAALLSRSKPTAVLLTDRRRTRIFTFSTGDVTEWPGLIDPVPKRMAQGGWAQMRLQRRSDEWAKHHIDHVARVALRLLQHENFDWLILGTEVDVEHDLGQKLHPYLKDRVIGRFHMRVDAPEAEVMAQARQIREQAADRLIERLQAQILEYEGAGGRARTGLDGVLHALSAQQVHILLVQEGYEHSGARCLRCSWLGSVQPERCPRCDGTVEEIDDVVDAAIQRAFELGSVVEVATTAETLAPIEGIGAILYY